MATVEIPCAIPGTALFQCIGKELGDGEFQDEAQAALKGVMTTDVICINVLVASTGMMDHD